MPWGTRCLLVFAGRPTSAQRVTFAEYHPKRVQLGPYWGRRPLELGPYWGRKPRATSGKTRPDRDTKPPRCRADQGRSRKTRQHRGGYVKWAFLLQSRGRQFESVCAHPIRGPGQLADLGLSLSLTVSLPVGGAPRMPCVRDIPMRFPVSAGGASLFGWSSGQVSAGADLVLDVQVAEARRGGDGKARCTGPPPPPAGPTGRAGTAARRRWPVGRVRARDARSADISARSPRRTTARPAGL
jgi:hypothetical protein